MPTKYSYDICFASNMQGKYGDLLWGEFVREILYGSKGTRLHDPRDPFQANATVKTHSTVCGNEHKHF